MTNDIKLFSRNIIIACLVGIVLVAIVFFGLIPVIGKTEKAAYLDLLVAPVEAKVMIIGVEYRDAIYEFEPGI